MGDGGVGGATMHSVPFMENELRQRHLYVKLGVFSSSPPPPSRFVVVAAFIKMLGRRRAASGSESEGGVGAAS